MSVLGQIEHKIEWFTWRNSESQKDEIRFACTCGAWSRYETIDPIAAFRGKALKFAGRSLGEEVLKAGLTAGRSFQEHLATAQIDVVMWAGQP